MTSLTNLFLAVANSLDGDLDIERAGRKALIENAEDSVCSVSPSEITPLPETISNLDFEELDQNLANAVDLPKYLHAEKQFT